MKQVGKPPSLKVAFLRVKIVQEAIRIIPEVICEPIFLNTVHRYYSKAPQELWTEPFVKGSPRSKFCVGDSE